MIAGPIGTGKTLSRSRSASAARRRHRVAYCARPLVRELVEARDELTSPDCTGGSDALLIVDELGFALRARRGELIFNPSTATSGATIVTTNLGQRVEVFGDEAAALLDRLGHHAQILTSAASPTGRGIAHRAPEHRVHQAGGGA